MRKKIIRMIMGMVKVKVIGIVIILIRLNLIGIREREGGRGRGGMLVRVGMCVRNVLGAVGVCMLRLIRKLWYS